MQAISCDKGTSGLGVKDILSPQNLGVLAAFASSNVLIGFDFDGTLAPIVPTPAQAAMRSATRARLRRVAECYPCIVISGRGHADIVKRLGTVPVWHVFGNHGCEPWNANVDVAAVVRAWVARLRPCLGPSPGIVVEDKTYSVAIHFRHAPDKTKAKRVIAAAVANLPTARVLGGDHAVNLVVEGASTKGITLQRVRQSLACETAIYVGDDDTDEDAFASAAPSHLLAIRIGSSGRGSSARYRLKTQRAIDDLLDTLVHLRQERRCRAPRRLETRT